MWRIFTSEMGTLKVSLRRPVPLAQPTGSPFLLSICSHLVYFNGDFTFTYVDSALYLSSSWQESQPNVNDKLWFLLVVYYFSLLSKLFSGLSGAELAAFLFLKYDVQRSLM